MKAIKYYPVFHSTYFHCTLFQIVVSMGSGEDPENTYRSHIYYQNKNPKWHEVVKVGVSSLPFYQFYNCASYAKSYRRDGVVVRASASQSVDVGFIPCVNSYLKTLKTGIHSFPAWR